LVVSVFEDVGGCISVFEEVKMWVVVSLFEDLVVSIFEEVGGCICI
jgi:hypothetical protein